MKSKASLGWITLLVAVTLVAALWVLPARWAMAWIPESSPVQISNASGTIWNARATVALGVEGTRRTLPDPVQWRLVFDGGPKLMLSHPWLGGPMALKPSLKGLNVSAQSLQLPATLLTAVHPLFNALDPGGEVHLAWPELALGPAGVVPLSGPALLTAQWRNASSALTRLRPMGAYTLTLQQGAGNIVTLALATASGPLTIDGTGTLARSRIQFDGRAGVQDHAGGDVRAALQGLLDVMGPRSPSGHSILKIR
ncbi:MAG TPA: type II secretion system protein N [Pusillimonas sp.]|uniref:type II secretion system protein N n=1 Tax=Pusillimonas sp. TaxID=3040095 RepID=UPI002B7F060D|nr:type II secretion system protein N [Pusillimonas sp.]HUH87845.1 type II secretion system protein N [Pusillimonas sp.]